MSSTAWLWLALVVVLAVAGRRLRAAARLRRDRAIAQQREHRQALVQELGRYGLPAYPWEDAGQLGAKLYAFLHQPGLERIPRTDWTLGGPRAGGGRGPGDDDGTGGLPC